MLPGGGGHTTYGNKDQTYQTSLVQRMLTEKRLHLVALLGAVLSGFIVFVKMIQSSAFEYMQQMVKANNIFRTKYWQGKG